MRISIALATYKGATYLPEQLASYLAQTRLPDELVVCDDNSPDETVALLNAFARTAPFPVRIERNGSQLGIFGNFSKVIQLCRGDIIVFSDQDDEWLPHKLERIEAAFMQSPNLAAVMSDALIVNQRLEPLGYTLWESKRFTRTQQRALQGGHALEVLCRSDYSFGITLAFRASYQDQLLPLPSGGFHHDLWTARYLSAVGGFGLIPEPLLKYRQHPKQHVGAKRTSVANRVDVLAIQTPGATMHRRYGKRVYRFQQVKERVEQHHPECRESIGFLDRHIRFLEWRGNLPSRRILRVPACIRELLRGTYHHHAEGLISFGKDLLQKDRDSEK